MLIGSLVSTIQVSHIRFIRKRFTIYKPLVSLEDRRVNVSRGQSLFASSVSTAYYHMLTETGISRNFSKKRQILIQRRGTYFGKSADASRYYSGKSISIALPLTHRLVYIWVSDKFAYSNPINDPFYPSRIHDQN